MACPLPRGLWYTGASGMCTHACTCVHIECPESCKLETRVPERCFGYGPKWPRPTGPPGQEGLGEMLRGEGLAGRWGPSAPQHPGWQGSCLVAGSFVRGSRGGTQPSAAPELGRGAGCGRSLAVTAFSVQARGSAFTNSVIKEKAL